MAGPIPGSAISGYTAVTGHKAADTKLPAELIDAKIVHYVPRADFQNCLVKDYLPFPERYFVCSSLYLNQSFGSCDTYGECFLRGNRSSLVPERQSNAHHSG